MTDDADDLKRRRLISKPVVLEVAAFSSATLDRKVRDRSFPAPVRISANRVAWRWTDINEWLDDPAAWLARAQRREQSEGGLSKLPPH